MIALFVLILRNVLTNGEPIYSLLYYLQRHFVCMSYYQEETYRRNFTVDVERIVRLVQDVRPPKISPNPVDEPSYQVQRQRQKSSNDLWLPHTGRPNKIMDIAIGMGSLAGHKRCGRSYRLGLAAIAIVSPRRSTVAVLVHAIVTRCWKVSSNSNHHLWITLDVGRVGVSGRFVNRDLARGKLLCN